MPTPNPRRRGCMLRLVIGAIAVLLGALWLNSWCDIDREKSGREYESQIADWPQDLVKDFPRKIPPSATAVRMYSDSPSIMIGPGHFIEVAFIGSPADVNAAIAAGTAALSRVNAAHGPDPRHAAEWLRVWGKARKHAPLPPGFQCYLLVTQAENFSGVVVNPTTGEIAYWASIH